MVTAPIALAREEGEHVWYDGGLITFKATGAQTAGALLFFEALMPVGKATPLHVHPESDETLYVLEGELHVLVEASYRSVGTGAVVVVPRGTPHAFCVIAGPARLLVAFTPASAISEAFFRQAGEPADTPTLPTSNMPMERTIAAAEQTGLKVLGPPPFGPLRA